MAELTIKQKKEWAASLYLRDNLTQQEIADKTGCDLLSFLYLCATNNNTMSVKDL